MTAKMRYLIAEVKRLDREATKGPWHSDRDGDVKTSAEFEECEITESYVGGRTWKSIGTTAVFRANTSNQDLIANYRSMAPILAQALEIAMDALLSIIENQRSWGDSCLSDRDTLRAITIYLEDNMIVRNCVETIQRIERLGNND